MSLFLLTNPVQCYLSLSVWYVCVCVCVLFVYTIYICIICVSKDEHSFIASNRRICLLQLNFCGTLWKVNFWYQWIIHLIIKCNKCSCSEQITGGINIYLYGCVSVLAPECAVCICVFLCVISNVFGLYYMCQISVNLMLYCIKHTSRSFWY